MAFVIPIQHGDGERGPCVLLVVLTKDNWRRMRAGDPFDVQLRGIATAATYLDWPLRELDLIIAYEEDEQELMRIVQEGGLPALMAHIERRRVHREGDAEPPVSVKPAKVRPQ